MSTSMAERLRQTSRKVSSDTIQLVSFRLGDERYGIDIYKVREIQLLQDVAKIPHTPDYVRGLMNLRDTVLPIIDLRLRFEMPAADPKPENRTIVLNLEDRMVGINVDAVEEVLRVTPDMIDNTPPVIEGSNNDYLKALVKMDDELLIMLDVDRMFNTIPKTFPDV